MSFAIPKSWRRSAADALDIASVVGLYLVAATVAIGVLMFACILRALPFIVAIAAGLALFALFGVI